MSYATKQDMIDRFSQAELAKISDRTNVPPTTIDDGVVQGALDSADGKANGYLQAAGLTVPLATVPRSLIDGCCAITRYLLWKDKASDRVRQDYEDTIAWLLNVSKGLVQLGDNVAPAPTSSAGAPQMAGDSCRTFTRRSLRDF